MRGTATIPIFLAYPSIRCFFYCGGSAKTNGCTGVAEQQKVSPTYLSKILTKLVKAGMIESITGVNGGIDSNEITKLGKYFVLEYYSCD